MAKRISIINFKGGVGKTTFSYQLAAGLARYHQARVLMIDLDHESNLSITALTAANWQQLVAQNRTACEMFKPFLSEAPVPDDSLIEKQAIKQTSVSANYKTLDIVPASFELDDVEVDLIATHRGKPMLSEWEKRTLICQWLEEARVDRQYDYIIFDCPPATKIVSQNALAASHGYFVPVVPDVDMERGVPHMVELIKARIDARLKPMAGVCPHRETYVADTELAGLVVTRIQTHGVSSSGYTEEHTRHLGTLKKQWGNLLMTPYIEQSAGVSDALEDGVPVYDRYYTQNIRGLDSMYKNLVATVKKRVDAL